VEQSCYSPLANELLTEGFCSNGDNVESAQGMKMQEKFIEELFAKLEKISPGVTNI